jgi:ribonuclease VapC
LTEPTRRSVVVDTSAAVAIILGEPGREELALHLENALARLMPAAIRVGLGIVIEARLWPAGQDVVDRFLRDAKIDIMPVDADLAARAMSGWRRYGKARHRCGYRLHGGSKWHDQLRNLRIIAVELRARSS